MSSVAAASLRASAFRRKVSSSSSSTIQHRRNRNVVIRPSRSARAMTNGDVDKKGEEEKEKDAFTSASSNNAQVLQAFSLAPFLVFSPKAFAAGAFDSVSNAFSSPAFHELSMYTMKTLISWGVPAVTVGFVALMIISGARKGKSSSDGDEDGASPSPSAFSKAGRRARNREHNHIYPSSD